MPESILAATLLVVVGGLTAGSFLLPMRLAHHWNWENMWLIYSIVGMLIVPLAVAVITIPSLILVYSSVATKVFLVTGLFGLCWGVANVLFGLAARIVGMALTFAVVVGMSAALGCLIPLLLDDPTRLLQPSGLIILAGVALTLLGISVMAQAGIARERGASSRRNLATHPSMGTTLGLTLCVVSGFLAPMLNYGFVFGAPIREQAIHYGAGGTQAANAVWVVVLAGGFISNATYSVFLATKAKTWSNFGRSSRLALQYALAASMGVLFMGGILMYGWGATWLGDLGPVIGWPIFQATTIVFSSVLGIAMGEWRGVEARISRTNTLGLSILVVAIIVLSLGNRT